MPYNQSNLPYTVQQQEQQAANQWYETVMRDEHPVIRYNQYPTACPMGCKVGRVGTCPHGYRSFAVLVRI